MADEVRRLGLAGHDSSLSSAGKLHLPLWLLVLITFSGTLAMHMFVPALPPAAQDLGASAAAMQGTISLYIVGLAIGQLIYGPLSDCFGRRPVLMVGLVLYTAAGIAAVLASSVQMRVTARFIQALGGCTGLVLGRAMVRDVSAPEDAVRRLAGMNLVVVIGPALAPLAGSVLSSTLGWRSIFLVLIGLGAANILFAWRLLPETGRPTGSISVLGLGRDYQRLLSSPAFLGYAIGGDARQHPCMALQRRLRSSSQTSWAAPCMRSGFFLDCWPSASLWAVR
jgi:DHA1 family bicyclomycin/chloramphenicol resistance-like MFS transporter